MEKRLMGYKKNLNPMDFYFYMPIVVSLLMLLFQGTQILIYIIHVAMLVFFMEDL